MRKILLLFFICAWAPPLLAGTDVKARLEGYSYKEAWAQIEASIGEGRLRLDFQGPWTHGSLIYDRESSQLTLIDHLHRTILPLSQDSQSTLKFLGAIAAGRLQREMSGSDPAAQRAYRLVEENAQALFNGTPDLTGRAIGKEGFTCDEYRTDLDGKRAREVWVTAPEKAGMSGEDYDTLRSLAHLVVDLCGTELAQLGADPSAFQQGLAQPQVPVLAVLYAKGRPSGEFKILQIHSRDFAPGTFDPPAGYQALSLLDLLKQGGHSNP
jgi:hypothetical protein